MEVIPKHNRQFMPVALEVKRSGLPPQESYIQFLFGTYCGSTLN